MNDDIGARLGIIHRAGCMAPTTYAAMPFATMTGHNPYVALVADGEGGELFRCTICGMVQGQRPEDSPATEPPAPGASATPMPSDGAGWPTLAQILATKAELEADGPPAGARTIAKRLGCHESTVRRRMGRRK
jgi:hypothetical protein